MARKTRRSPALSPAQMELFESGAGLLHTPKIAAAPTGNIPAPPEDDAVECTPLDRQFARLMVRLNGREDAVLTRAAEMASAWRAAGHSCAPVEPGDLAALLATAVVGEPGSERPLILDAKNRLYLLRYWLYEEALAEAISRRISAPPPAIKSEWLERELTHHFPTAAPDRQGGQREAVRVALTKRFAVITGGPGTGKTRTVAVVLAALANYHAAVDLPPPRVLLAAPTGKAALRLTESSRGVLANLGLTMKIPEATTLHRLLGLTMDSPTPRWNAENLLPADAVIVDEASMVDLPMMAKLFAAVPAKARLILLGDQDQLASVETGHVLGDIWSAGQTGPLAAHLRELSTNFRFPEESGIHALSTAVREGHAEAALARLQAGGATDLSGMVVNSPNALAEPLASRVTTGFAAALKAKTPGEALRALSQFRLLCALREGPFGVSHLNRLTEEALAKAGLIVPSSRFYVGRVIMVQRNDYGPRLFNGDVGIIRRDEEGELRAYFTGEDGTLRALAPSRLPEHETAWAMTVHKSQGSEFGKVLLVLPAQESPVVTRELIYTGITRAREAVEVWYEPGAWKDAVTRQTVRMGGLRSRLQAP